MITMWPWTAPEQGAEVATEVVIPEQPKWNRDTVAVLFSARLPGEKVAVVELLAWADRHGTSCIDVRRTLGPRFGG